MDTTGWGYRRCRAVLEDLFAARGLEAPRVLAVTGPAAAPRTLLLGRYDDVGRLHYTGRTTTLSRATGTAFAAPSAPGTESAADRISVAPLAVVNLGLSTAEAANLQRGLKSAWGYTGAIDGQLGPESWKANQRALKQNWGYTGAIDGIVGSGTITALQRALKSYGYYTGALDGIAGPATQAAFRAYVNAHDW